MLRAEDYLRLGFAPASAEMCEGYFDGRDPSSPDPSSNRTFCYRHGFANGRDDLMGSPRAFGDEIRKLAREAELLDGFFDTDAKGASVREVSGETK